MVGFCRERKQGPELSTSRKQLAVLSFVVSAGLYPKKHRSLEALESIGPVKVAGLVKSSALCWRLPVFENLSAGDRVATRLKRSPRPVSKTKMEGNQLSLLLFK